MKFLVIVLSGILITNCTHIIYGFTYLGCINDRNLRVLPYETLELENSMTTENCIDHCLSFNIYAYAGTEYGKQCFCGLRNSSSAFVFHKDSDCNSRCTGNDSQMCGDYYLLSVYQLFTNDYTYIGCIVNSTNGSTLIYNITMENVMTTQICIHHCRSYMYMYAGLRNSTDCYCGGRGLTFTFVNNAECSISCAGAALEKCGSEWRLSMYILTVLEITTQQLEATTTDDVPSSSDVTLETTVNDTTLSQDECRCPCSNLPPYLLANMTINELIKRATKGLEVKKTATSKYRRSKISAPDDRRSSASMGFVAVLITSMPIILAIAVDLSNLYAWQKKYFAKI